VKKKILIILFYFLPLISYGSEVTQENLFEYLNSKKFISANFIQTTEIETKTRSVQGSIKANRSGKFKIQYLEPILETISSDGKFLYKLDLELDQFDVVPQEDYFSNTPISIFISEIKDLKALFHINGCKKKEKQTVCIIVPKSEDSFLEELALSFEKDNLASIRYSDSFGQTVTLKLNKIDWMPFDESELTISIPEGIDVVYH